MPLNNIKDSDLRQYCKEHIESLELWLRRVIHDVLYEKIGPDYLHAKNEDKTNIISKNISKNIEDRYNKNPSRFKRPIDACLLETEIKIVTNPNLFHQYFREIFDYSFPNGNIEMLRIFLNRLVDPRNKLYHANPISVREAEQIICYSNDIISSIKDYYNKMNKEQEFNVPLILKYKDSFGNEFNRSDFTGKTVIGVEIIDLKRKEYFLRPGDKISMEIEVDSSFNSNSYEVNWSPDPTKIQNDHFFNYTIQNKDVGENFNISVSIKSNKDWHRLAGKDDYLVIRFKVLPPIN